MVIGNPPTVTEQVASAEFRGCTRARRRWRCLVSRNTIRAPYPCQKERRSPARTKSLNGRQSSYRLTERESNPDRQPPTDSFSLVARGWHDRTRRSMSVSILHPNPNPNPNLNPRLANLPSNPSRPVTPSLSPFPRMRREIEYSAMQSSSPLPHLPTKHADLARPPVPIFSPRKEAPRRPHMCMHHPVPVSPTSHSHSHPINPAARARASPEFRGCYPSVLSPQ